MPEYIYRDEDGDPVSKVVRKGDKKFHIEHWTGEDWLLGRNGSPHIPYRLDEVLKAAGKPVYVMEGERDVDKAWEVGLVATCNQGGAGKWTDDDSAFLRGRAVTIVYDYDPAGARHAHKAAKSLLRSGASSVRFRRAAEGNDFSDHINNGHAVADLVKEPPTKAFPEASEPEPKPQASLDLGYLPGVLQLVLTKLDRVSEESGKQYQWNARCPAHEDRSPSLSVSLGDKGQILLKCQAGCDFYKIADALQVNPQDLMRKQLASEHDAKVEERVKQLHVQEDAKFQFHLERSRNILEISPSDNATGVDELEVPEESEQWLVDQWIPADSLLLLNAERKTGKSVLCLGLAKAICDEEPFLGRYQTNIEESGMRVLYLNYEMTPSMFRRWLREANFKKPENFLVKHLKGRSLPFNDAATRDQLAAYCARMQVGVIIFDTQIKAMTDLGVNENDNSEVTTFHAAVEALMELSGVRVCLFAHHLGKADKEKGRGASRIEDGVDVIMTLAKEVGSGGSEELEAHAAPRSLRGEGREVAQEPVELEYNADTRMYTTRGSSPARKARVSKHEAFVGRVMEFYTNKGRWPNTTEARRLTGVSNKDNGQRLFLNECAELKLIVRTLVQKRGTSNGDGGTGKPSIQYRVPKGKSTP